MSRASAACSAIRPTPGQANTDSITIVPPIKPAAALSRSRCISVLATPGTVARAYTQDLISAHAGDCQVTLVGSPRLAELATAELCGEAVLDADVLAEIRPAFVEEGAARKGLILARLLGYRGIDARLQPPAEQACGVSQAETACIPSHAAQHSASGH